MLDANLPTYAVTTMVASIHNDWHHGNAPERFSETVAEAAKEVKRFGWPILVHDHLHSTRDRCNGRRCRIVFRNRDGVVVA